LKEEGELEKGQEKEGDRGKKVGGGRATLGGELRGKMQRASERKMLASRGRRERDGGGEVCFAGGGGRNYYKGEN